MLKISIISVGKIKNSDLKNTIMEYEKRLSKYAKLEIVELSDLYLNEKPSKSEIDACLSKEGAEILKRISEKDFTFAMCIEGKQMTSEALANKISDISHTCSKINFVIGSSFGLSEEVKKAADFKLSMSEMTFPHNIAKLMLTEQVYRAFKIIANESYHK